MDYIKIRFGGDLEQMDSEFKRNIESMFRTMGPRFTCTECAWTPPMDMYETADEIMILAEVAGIKKEDLDIEINSKAVKILGKRLDSPKEAEGTYRLAEIQRGRFERILFLPAPIHTEKVSASYHDGMLQIRLVKMPKDTTHKISISED